MWFVPIGGKLRFPIRPSLLQTDGSFHPKTHTGFVAMVLHHNNTTYTKFTMMASAEDSTETEWASISSGMIYALEKNVKSIYIENDNLGVVNKLLTTLKKKEKPYVAHYKYEILRLAKETEWTGIRWIPRNENKADDLFR